VASGVSFSVGGFTPRSRFRFDRRATAESGFFSRLGLWSVVGNPRPTTSFLLFPTSQRGFAPSNSLPAPVPPLPYYCFSVLALHFFTISRVTSKTDPGLRGITLSLICLSVHPQCFLRMVFLPPPFHIYWKRFGVTVRGPFFYLFFPSLTLSFCLFFAFFRNPWVAFVYLFFFSGSPPFSLNACWVGRFFSREQLLFFIALTLSGPKTGFFFPDGFSGHASAHRGRFFFFFWGGSPSRPLCLDSSLDAMRNLFRPICTRGGLVISQAVGVDPHPVSVGQGRFSHHPPQLTLGLFFWSLGYGFFANKRFGTEMLLFPPGKGPVPQPCRLYPREFCRRGERGVVFNSPVFCAFLF